MKAMNVTELARRVRVTTKELLEILPEVGIDVGKRAIKIDGKQAQNVIESWPRLHAEYRAKQQPEEQEAETIAAQEERAPVPVPPRITVRALAEKLKLPLPKVMGELMKNGVLASMNQDIDFDTAAIVGAELGYEIIPVDATVEEEAENKKLEAMLANQDQSGLVSRPPVVVVMGHVDHGKTRLLDAIRQTNVVAGESGGITQHIGAYQVIKKNQSITFIDTPGHEAFITMRSRGARVADLAILVVAADDSIQEQTKESIKIIKSANLPMVVAINKIDKPDANIEKVKSDLASLGLTPEDWGGKTITVPISAKEGTGIDDLLDMILLVAGVEKDHIQANPNMDAAGTVIESHVDKGMGPVATILIQAGTLRKGQSITSGGTYYGRIRAMRDYLGQPLTAAGPSTPVQIQGLKAAPSVGDIMQVSAKVDRNMHASKFKLEEKMTYSKPLERSDDESQAKVTLNVFIKADVLGSLEAILDSLSKFEHADVAVSVVGKGLGNVTESEIERAESSGAKVLTFHVEPTQAAEKIAKDKKVEIHEYEVIYKLVEDVRVWLEALIQPEIIRHDLGRLKVLAIFKKDTGSMVIGGSVTKGILKLGAKVNVLRNDGKITSGTIEQLQLNKIEVKEVTHGNECGLRFVGKPWIEEGDILEAYVEEQKIKKL